MLKKTLITTLLLLIQSCGSDSVTNQNNNTPAEFKFTLLAKLINQCGQQTAFSQLEVHLQDENWQLIKKYTADTNGQISFITEQQEINYTIVAKSQQGESEESLDIISYYHANASTPAWYTATYDKLQDNNGCECITQDIELKHRVFSKTHTISTSFNHDNIQAIDSQTTHFTNSEVCRKIDDAWPIQSISIRGLDANNNAIGVANTFEYVNNQTENLLQLSAIEVADIVSLPKTHAAFQLTQMFKKGEHFKTSIAKDDTALLLFNTHPYISESTYNAETSFIYENIDTIFGHSSFSSYHQIRSSSYEKTFAVFAETNKPSIDSARFSELSSDGSYDYSAVSDYPFVEIVFDYQVNSASSGNSIPVKWTMYGPIKGTLAYSVPLSFLEWDIDMNNDIQITNIKIIKSLYTNKYNDYIQHYQGNTETNLIDNFKYYHLQLVQ